MALLEVSQVDAGYGRIKILSGVGFEVNSGEVNLFLGPNGAGKSTLLRALSGMCDVMAGEVRLDGEPVHDLPTHRIARLGMSHVPEGRQLFPGMSVADNLDLGAQGAELRRRRSGLMSHVLEMFPVLKSRLRQNAGTLSGGEQQMLAIGRALMSDPKVLLLDEPSTGLAPALFVEVLSSLGRIAQDGRGVVLVEQVLPTWLSAPGRGRVLRDGSIVYEDSLAGLLNKGDLWETYLGAGEK